MKRWLVLLLLLALMSLLRDDKSRASACCADPGAAADVGSKPDDHDPILQKEWVLKGATTIVDSRLNGIIGKQAILILQGSGNHCFTAQDLEHWILQLSTSSKDFSRWERAWGTIDAQGVDYR